MSFKSITAAQHAAGHHYGKQQFEAATCEDCAEELRGRNAQAKELHSNRVVESINASLEALSHHPSKEEEANAIREAGIRHMLAELGDDPSREGLLDTPGRVIEAWKELTKGYKTQLEDFMTVFTSEGYDHMIVCGPIRFYSTCEHHLLPFFGDAWVAYVPEQHIVGLSKLPRLVEMFSRRLQNQERMTNQIVDALNGAIAGKGAACLVRGQHMCMMARGVRQQEAAMVTTCLRGVFLEPSVRAEFLSQAR